MQSPLVREKKGKIILVLLDTHLQFNHKIKVTHDYIWLCNPNGYCDNDYSIHLSALCCSSAPCQNMTQWTKLAD